MDENISALGADQRARMHSNTINDEITRYCDVYAHKYKYKYVYTCLIGFDAISMTMFIHMKYTPELHACM